MKLYGKKSISEILVVFLNLVILIGAIITAKVYYTTFWTNRNAMSSMGSIVIAVLLTIGVICTFLIVVNLRSVVKTLVDGDPFTSENVKRLKWISLECFVISACYIANILYNMSNYVYRFIYIDNRGIHTDTEPVIFILAGVFILVLAEVFKQAVNYKEENDYTV